VLHPQECAPACLASCLMMLRAHCLCAIHIAQSIINVTVLVLSTRLAVHSVHFFVPTLFAAASEEKFNKVAYKWRAIRVEQPNTLHIADYLTASTCTLGESIVVLRLGNKLITEQYWMGNMEVGGLLLGSMGQCRHLSFLLYSNYLHTHPPLLSFPFAKAHQKRNS